MDFQCPQCLGKLTVPDQYAGTLMKCPLCSKNFTAPSLPPAMPSLGDAPASPPPAASYAVVSEPPPASPPPGPAPEPASAPRASAPPPPTSTEYRGGVTLMLDAAMLPWIAPGCLIAIFFLLFFPWVGQYWYGHGVNTQSAWGAAFGYASHDPVWRKDFPPGKETPVAFTRIIEEPGYNLLVLLYILVLLVGIVACVAAVILPRAGVKLPPQVEMLWPWRWSIIAGASLLGFVLLCTQTVLGFSIENRLIDELRKQFITEVKPDKTSDTIKSEELQVGRDLNTAGLVRTSYLQLAFWLQFLAAATSGLQLWLERRGGGPPPSIEVRW